VAASQLVGGFLAQYCFGVITERLARRVRERTFLKMLQLDVAWFDAPEHAAGALAQQLATDCVQIKALTGERASTSVSQVCAPPGRRRGVAGTPTEIRTLRVPCGGVPALKHSRGCPAARAGQVVTLVVSLGIAFYYW
jgi:hypothetical protein